MAADGIRSQLQTDVTENLLKDKAARLSVIVPVYNCEEYLEECIESIIASSYQNLEIILVDDGARGKEPEICDFYVKKDARVKVIHKKNAGCVAARKTGIERATAPFVAFVDSDDYVSRDYFERMMTLMLSIEADLVCVGLVRVEEEKKYEMLQAMDNGVYENEKLCYLWENMNCKERMYYQEGIAPSNCCKVFKTEKLRHIIVNTPEFITLGEDAANTFPYLLTECQRVVVDNTNCGYYYRYVPKSMTSETDEKLAYKCSALIEYLRKYYLMHNNDKISEQLELYRAYLAENIVRRQLYCCGVKGLHAAAGKLKEQAKGESLFEHFPPEVLKCMPKKTASRLQKISENKFKRFEFAEFVGLIIDKGRRVFT